MINNRFNAKTISRDKKLLFILIPNHQSKFAAQVFETIDAVFFIQVQGNFTIAGGFKLVALCLQFRADALKIVELAVDDHMNAAIGTAYWLCPGSDTHGGQASVTECDCATWRDKNAFSIWASMMNSIEGAVYRLLSDR